MAERVSVSAISLGDEMLTRSATEPPCSSFAPAASFSRDRVGRISKLQGPAQRERAARAVQPDSRSERQRQNQPDRIPSAPADACATFGDGCAASDIARRQSGHDVPLSAARTTRSRCDFPAWMRPPATRCTFLRPTPPAGLRCAIKSCAFAVSYSITRRWRSRRRCRKGRS